MCTAEEGRMNRGSTLVGERKKAFNDRRVLEKRCPEKTGVAGIRKSGWEGGGEKKEVHLKKDARLTTS